MTCASINIRLASVLADAHLSLFMPQTPKMASTFLFFPLGIDDNTLMVRTAGLTCAKGQAIRRLSQIYTGHLHPCQPMTVLQQSKPKSASHVSMQVPPGSQACEFLME